MLARAVKRPRALWLQLRNVPILRMLQLEEALFRTDRRSWFITNEWDSAQPAAEALVLGISGRPEQMLHVEAAQRSGIPVIKRFTGGGTVVVDSDTLFASFIVAEGALPDVKPYPEPMLAWSGAQPLARATRSPHRPPSPHRHRAPLSTSPCAPHRAPCPHRRAVRRRAAAVRRRQLRRACQRLLPACGRRGPQVRRQRAVDLWKALAARTARSRPSAWQRQNGRQNGRQDGRQDGRQNGRPSAACALPLAAGGPFGS